MEKKKRFGDSWTKTQHAAITSHTYPIEEYGIVLTKTVAWFNEKPKHKKVVTYATSTVIALSKQIQLVLFILAYYPEN